MSVWNYFNHTSQYYCRLSKQLFRGGLTMLSLHHSLEEN